MNSNFSMRSFLDRGKSATAVAISYNFLFKIEEVKTCRWSKPFTFCKPYALVAAVALQDLNYKIYCLMGYANLYFMYNNQWLDGITPEMPALALFLLKYLLIIIPCFNILLIYKNCLWILSESYINKCRH